MASDYPFGIFKLFLYVYQTYNHNKLRILSSRTLIICLSDLSTFSVPDEGYSRNVLCTLNLISTFFFTENTHCATKNGGCALFCLPIPTGRTCGCEDGDTLKSDGTSCTGRKYIHVLAYLERQNNIMHYKYIMQSSPNSWFWVRLS